MRLDETAALADLHTSGPVLLYMLPDKWVERHFPLQVGGAAETPVRAFFVVQQF